MPKTKIWSLQFTCRRLAREARILDGDLRDTRTAAKEVEQHLARAAELLSEAMTELGAEEPRTAGDGLLELAQLAFGENAWGHSVPVGDYDAPDRSQPSGEHHLAMRAAADFVATPDLIAFLCSMQKTGVLLVDTDDERFTVELCLGHIVHAHSDGAPEGERLGDVLIEHGVLDRPRLEQELLAGLRDQSSQRLGRRLIEREVASREQLLGALETQIRRLFQRLFTATARDFAFWDGPCIWGEDDMRLNATMLLLDGARAVDESSRDRQSAAALQQAAANAAGGTAASPAEGGGSDAAAGQPAEQPGSPAGTGSGWLLGDAGDAAAAAVPPPFVAHPLSPTPSDARKATPPESPATPPTAERPADGGADIDGASAVADTSRAGSDLEPGAAGTDGTGAADGTGGTDGTGDTDDAEGPSARKGRRRRDDAAPEAD